MIEATLHVQIQHRSGPEIGDPDHVRAWLVADGAWFEGRNGVGFEVCPKHADPEECPQDCDASMARYFATFDLVGGSDDEAQ